MISRRFVQRLRESPPAPLVKGGSRGAWPPLMSGEQRRQWSGRRKNPPQPPLIRGEQNPPAPLVKGGAEAA
jgi:hypothetical protein